MASASTPPGPGASGGSTPAPGGAGTSEPSPSSSPFAGSSMNNRVGPLSGSEMSDEEAPSSPKANKSFHPDFPDVPTPSQDSFSFKKCWCSCGPRGTCHKLRHQVVIMAIIGFIWQHFGMMLDNFHLAQVHNFVAAGVVKNPPFGTTFLTVVSWLSMLTRNFCISANFILFFRVKKFHWGCFQRFMDKFACPFMFYLVSHLFLLLFNILQIGVSVMWLAESLDSKLCMRNNIDNGTIFLSFVMPGAALGKGGEDSLGKLMSYAIHAILVGLMIQIGGVNTVSQYYRKIHRKGEFSEEDNQRDHPHQDEAVEVQPSSVIESEIK